MLNRGLGLRGPLHFLTRPTPTRPPNFAPIKKALRILRNTALTLLGVILLLLALIQLSPVQTWLARRAAVYLAGKLKTRVEVGGVDISFRNRLILRGLYIEDQHRDTLLYAGEAAVRMSDWFWTDLKKTPVIHYVSLSRAYAHLYRTQQSDEWNYAFIEKAFDTGPRDSTKKQNEFELDLRRAALEDVRIHMDDAWVGQDLDIDIGALDLDANSLDLKKRLIDVERLALRSSTLYVNDYKGGRPPRPKKKKITDTTAFNPGGWQVKAASLLLSDLRFRMDAVERPAWPGDFDPGHMDITGITANVSGLTIDADTLHARLHHLEARDRCGFVLSHLAGDVAVSPNFSIVENLALRTPQSAIGDYYAMRYERFPDFTDYINKVRMEARLTNSVVAAKDVAFFAPELRRLDISQVSASGEMTGTVTNLQGRNLAISDGTSSLRGDLAVQGLPDVDNTIFRLSNGAVATTGDQLLTYLPQLRNSPDVNLAALGRITYAGDFLGTWHTFGANGLLTTALGNVRSDVRLKLPPFGSPQGAYEGTVVTTGFRLGTLLRQPTLGSIAVNARLEGTGLDVARAQLTTHATISSFQLGGYTYQGIRADGVWGQKKFVGELLVDDPNLALSFDGTADFGGATPAFNATAHLLNADLQKLGFVQDSIHGSADFDLDVAGSNIDNFQGVARLYNINLMRQGRRMDVDSLYLRSSPYSDSVGKELVLQSNFASARLAGYFELSTLPAAALHYLANYIPNYIVRPREMAAPQNLTFDIRTHDVDSLLAVLLPDLKGLDGVELAGKLNTNTQTLELNGSLPFMQYQTMSLRNVELKGTGNFQGMDLTASAGEMQLGDSLLKLSLQAATHLANDSLSFRIASNSPQAYGTATLNGVAYARQDSFFTSLAPSEFFVNGVHWEIPAGADALFSRGSLFIDELLLKSNEQSIAVSADGQHARALIKDLKVGSLNAFIDLEDYPLSGVANGSVDVQDLFASPVLSTNLRVRNAMLGRDTLGDVNVEGSLATATNTLTLTNQTGLFRNGGWITAGGTFDLDTSNQIQQGTIQLYHAPLSLVQPFATGLVSNLSGTVNGSIEVRGGLQKPDIRGMIALENAHLKVDYTGVEYTLNGDSVMVSSRAIALPDLEIRDRFGNTGVLNGSLSHDNFSDIAFNLRLNSNSIEALHLASYENPLFYGDVTAKASVTMTGPLTDLRMSIQAEPSQPSRLYMPLGGAGSSSPATAYSFVTFRNDKQSTAPATTRKKPVRLSVNIDAQANPLLEYSMILDASTGDEIYATGEGTIRLEVPADGDPRIYGAYNIERGRYTFTFRQLFYKRTFQIGSGSRISFSGPIDQTELAVKASYRTRASLYDLLSKQEKDALPSGELADTRRVQDVNVLLNMSGHLDNPHLTFRMELPEKRSVGTTAYNKLETMNQRGESALYEQVASLLLIGVFFPPEGLESGASAISGGVNNISEILSTTTSDQLTNVLNKLLNDPKLVVDLKYKNYNVSDGSASSAAVNRNEVKLGLRRNFFNDRLILEVGSAYDWGRPTANSTNARNFNPVGDFRAQYLMNHTGTLRLNAFSLSSYDVLLDQNINRRGLGIAWRKSFDSVGEFFGGKKK